ncbi:unnamed protein product [Cylicocyclus nassatus]|uniref:Uncharacterized protein n=1 Tax=Cylicocyclus nassatus TaxID=53992 RepID=A0AA36M962_CYLNA|nr:unnamed protein product [Cylicocyclus nassatus]
MSPSEIDELSDDDEETEMSMDEISEIFEAIITQVAAADLVEGFGNGVEKILSLCNLPSLVADMAASTLSTTVGSIVKFVLGKFRNWVWDAWLTDTSKRLHLGFLKVSVILISRVYSCYVIDASFDSEIIAAHYIFNLTVSF